MSTEPAASSGVASRLVTRWRSVPLLGQLGPVALGLVVLGLGSFAYLSVTGRALGPTA